MTSFSYDPKRRQLVSYDTPHIASLKAKYVQANGLAGSMFWEVCRSRPPFLRRGKCAEYLAVSYPWIRKDPPRLLVLPPGYTVALTRHQYVRVCRLRSSHHQSDTFLRYPESHTVKRLCDAIILSSQRIIDDRTAIPIVNGTTSATTWVKIRPTLHLPNRCLPLLPQPRGIVQAWRRGLLQ